MKVSIIIPLFNRPDEISELLSSLTHQDVLNTHPDDCALFEVIVVEDGSTISSKEIVQSYADKLPIIYLEKENGGPAQARNFGVDHCNGNWLTFIDSDCVLPSGWLRAIINTTQDDNTDLFGGADKASSDFSPIQKAINYSMTSFFTTGGIRGSKNSMEKFHPRSFNMTIRKSIFDKVGQFASDMRFGEDVDLSIRLMKAGARSGYIEDAWLYHKRRVDFTKFYRQVRASGTARIALWHKHPHSLKLVHLMPLAFFLYLIGTIVTVAIPLPSYITLLVILPLVIWTLLITIDSSIQNKSLKVGILSILSSIIQLSGYAMGFLWALFGGGKSANKNFYK